MNKRGKGGGGEGFHFSQGMTGDNRGKGDKHRQHPIGEDGEFSMSRGNV